jgi:hypothetical protein
VYYVSAGGGDRMNVITKKVARKNIEEFLLEMKEILCNPYFNIDRDFYFTEDREKDDPSDELSNKNTMLALNYDTSDIVRELKTLYVQEYTESMVDTVSKDLSFWHVFGRKIQNRDVYIKVRIKQRKNGTGFVFCISFHFARHIIADFPYK